VVKIANAGVLPARKTGVPVIEVFVNGRIECNSLLLHYTYYALARYLFHF